MFAGEAPADPQDLQVRPNCPQLGVLAGRPGGNIMNAAARRVEGLVGCAALRRRMLLGCRVVRLEISWFH